MPTADGTTSPTDPLDTVPTSTTSSATKRKRSSSAHTQTNGVTIEHRDEDPASSAPHWETTLDDALAILRTYDTEPSILELPLPPKRDRSSTSDEPNAKRTKLSERSSISSKVQERIYKTLDELAEDADTACAELLAHVQAKDATSNGSSGRIPQPLPDETLVARILAFRKIAKQIPRRALQGKLAANVAADGDMDRKMEDDKPAVNGVVTVKQEDREDDPFANGRTVLTLYGNAQGPKQLFSSLQRSVHVHTKGDLNPFGELDSAVDINIPLQEDGLPNVLSTTKVIPIEVEDALSGRKRGPTFGELFAPPATVPQLTPPKAVKQMLTRGSTVSFVPNEVLSRSRRKSGYNYTTETLSTGQWLGYNGVETPEEPSSPEAKRKQRDRALSTGESRPPISEEAAAALEQARTDALFRSVYSSFAPSRDDAIAVVPEATRNNIWWHKVGEKRFQQKLAIDPALFSWDEQGETNSAHADDEEKALEEAVENFEPPEDGFAKQINGDHDGNKAVDEVLKEISELLETLHSYQRIRNSSFASNPRTPASQNTPLAEIIGSPTDPSAAEIDVYKILKSQLSLMISSLPPYAVAKLNGQQLEDLNISRKLVIETKDYQGVMEEDQLSRLAKVAAITSASAATPVARMTSSSTAGTYNVAIGQQYGRTPSGSQVPMAARSTPAQSYFPQQQPPSRKSSTHHQRPSSSAAQPYQTPGSYPSSQRPAYGQQPYTQSLNRASYTHNAAQQYYQGRPSQPNYPHYYQSTPQTQPQSRNYPQSASSSYPQRAPAPPTYNYGSSQSPQLRTASPMKPGAPALPSQYSQSQYAQSRPTYGAVNGSQPRPPYPPASGQGTAQHGTQPSTPGSENASGYHNSMTTAEQQLMMDKQRAQLGVQSQTRAAQTNAARQGSGTPQPPNGQYGGQVNGTAMAV